MTRRIKFLKTILVSLFKIFAALRCRDTRTLPRIFAIQIVLNTPKNPYLKTWLTKFLPNFPTRKNPESKISSPQKSFDHPCHLKCGVTTAPLPPPLGSVPNLFYFCIGISLWWIRATERERENEIIYVFLLIMTSKKHNSISFWYSLQIQGEKEGMMFASNIFHQKATTSTANDLYSPPPSPHALKVFR